MKTQDYLGKKIRVEIDRPMNSLHPKHGFKYELNYGYVPHTVSGDGEELDAYVLGISQPLAEFTGICVAIIHRINDDDDKLIIVPEGMNFSDEEINHLTDFQEKWFQHIIIRPQPQIILLCGFLGFGKTTYAQKVALELPAILFTHDEIMKERFGRNPDDFAAKYKIVDDYIRAQTKQAVQQGQNVILDYGFWSKAKRREYYQWAKSLTPNVVFHVLECDMALAKQRVLNRTQTDDNALYIDENCFDTLLTQFERFDEKEGYPFVLINGKKNP